LRIPKVFASDSDIDEGTFVNMVVDKGKIIIERSRVNKYSLKELLDQITDKNIHGEIDAGGPVGKEIW